MPPTTSRSAAPTFTGSAPASSKNALTSPPSSRAATIGRTGLPKAIAFLKEFLPLQKPPNFQLVADELETRLGFKRHRESVAAFARTHFPNLICQPEPRPKARRRWERSRIDELWQHDSSIHQWWPAQEKQTLLLTVDDHSRKLLGAVFVPTDTTWNHFEHFRRLFLQHCLPMVVYTDGLSLFGHDSMADDRDPCSEFQRAFSALGVTHLVAPSPQAKGKIERRFGTLQKRLVAILAYEKVSSYAAAQIVLDREVQRQNATVCRTTGLSPNAAWEKACAGKTHRHASLSASHPAGPPSGAPFETTRQRRQPDRLSWPKLAHRPHQTILHHPHPSSAADSSGRSLNPQAPPLNNWPEILGKYSL